MQKDITLEFHSNHAAVVEALKNWGPEDLFSSARLAGYHHGPCTWTIDADRWPEVDAAMGKQFTALKELRKGRGAWFIDDTVRREQTHLIDAWCAWSEINGAPLDFPAWSEPGPDEVEEIFP